MFIQTSDMAVVEPYCPKLQRSEDERLAKLGREMSDCQPEYQAQGPSHMILRNMPVVRACDYRGEEVDLRKLGSLAISYK